MNDFQIQSGKESFNKRELEVLQLISNGLSNREIAQELHLSIETIKWYNKQMFMKLGVKNRIQAVNKAAELNLMSSLDGFPIQKKTSKKSNLPAQLTSFVGREKEISEILALLENNRLVVITGAGGSGKTRLALRVGEEILEKYKDGVWLVDFTNVRDPQLVVKTILNVLNVSESADIPLKEVLKQYLSRRNLLLLIDNLEHLLACAPLIGECLTAAPELSVLGTSRERLHIYGEQEYPIAPLNLPGSISDMDSLYKVESIALFIERARAVQPTFLIDDGSLEEIARICILLDGLPLAIELCAPMVRVFSLKAIADRIEKSLDAIPRGPRDLPARQQTLRDTIGWSFDLLEEDEKYLFKAMSVFNGEFTLQAVKSICGNGTSGNIENILSSLVNKKLVLARERQDGEIYFSLLGTIRQFGQEKLLDSREADQIADRHAKYFMKLAKQGAVELRGPNQIIWTNRFITIHDNMRAALEWLIKKGNTQNALRLVCDLFEFWLRHADFEEALQWIERAMNLPNAQQFQTLYTSVFIQQTWLFWLQGKAKEAIRMAEQALPMARSQPSKYNNLVALLNLGLILVLKEKDFIKGEAYLEEGRELSKDIHVEWEHARALMALAVSQSIQKNYTTSLSLYSKAYQMYTQLGDIGFQCVVKRLIGDLTLRMNNLNESVDAYRESLAIAQIVKNNLQVAYNFWGLARAGKIKGDHARTVRLYLASKRILDDMGVWSSEDEKELDEVLLSARTELGDTVFQNVLDAGQNNMIEETIKFVLDDKSIF